MHLRDYIKTAETTIAAFARQIGEEQATVSRYVNGKRIPQRGAMAKIVKATKGQVTPNDFYPLPSRGRAA